LNAKADVGFFSRSRVFVQGFVPGQRDPAFILILHNEPVQIVSLFVIHKNLHGYVHIPANLL
jgi:hypothetical protein